MLAARVSHVRRRIIVVHDHVGRETGACVVAFDQVVRQQRVLGEPAMRRDLERIDVVDALSRECPLAEQILVDIGYGGGVRVHAGTP